MDVKRAVAATLASLLAPLLLLYQPARSIEMPEPGKPLTLKQAIELALRNHPLRKAAVSEAEAAGERVGEARANLLPQVYGAAQYLRATTNGIGDTSYLALRGFPRLPSGSPATTSQSSTTNNNYLTGLTAEQYLFDFGRTRGYVDQRRAEAAAAADNLALTELDLTFQVAEKYFALLAARQLVEVYKSAVTQRQAHLDEARSKAASGLTAGIDVYTAQSDLARVQLNLTNAVAGTAVAKAELNYAVGLGDRAPDYQLADVLTYSEVVTPMSAFLDSALAKRPDLAGLQAQARAAGAQIVQNRSDYLPSFSATANYSARGQGLPAANNFDAGVVVIWPLFNGFATEHAVEEAKLSQARITHEMEALRQQIFVEVQSAYLNLKSAREGIRQAEAAVAASRTELELAEKRYQAGLGNIIELTDASRRYVEDDADYVNALYGFSVARASLARAAGQSM